MDSSNEQVRSVNIEEEMQRSYIDYSMSVIVGRALPDARDGLKPGNRRILHAMRERGWLHTKPFVKCAKVVGEVIGNYHPHGDMAVYDTLVRMAQDFSLRYTLVDGQGNFGSIDGDPPAAYRYTESRLSRLAEEMLADIDKSTVDMQPNFDETLQEPTVLPARLPNLLVNGATGIAVGMATNIPPHNLGEVVDGLILLIDRPQATVAELMHHVKGPDFPTGGIICGLQPIAEMYQSGRGQLKVRGRAGIEEGPQGKGSIVITEIPYAVNKTTLLQSIARLAQDKTVEGIADLRDESNKEGIRIVVELKRGAIPKVVLSNLYKHTQLQETFGAILLALDHGRPRVMNLKELMESFVDHRLEVVTRRARFDLAKAEARAHILEGLKIALDHLDAVVRTIRESRNRDEARERLTQRFKLSEAQANAILDMRLYQLTGLERDKVEEEYLGLIKEISYLRDLLGSRGKLLAVVKEDLREVRRTYADSRRTDIVPDEGEVSVEDLIADRGCVITISHTGYIKRTPVSIYRAQHRGGKGVSGMETKQEDYVEHLFAASTHDFILFFTAGGRVYWEKVYEIPEAGRAARGKAIVNLLNIRSDETIAAMIRVREFAADRHLVMATARGIVKKTSLAEFRNPRRDGIIAIAIETGDRLIAVKLTDRPGEIILATRKGLSIRFRDAEVRPMGRDTRGVRGIGLDADDCVECLEIVDPRATFLICTENGYGKRTGFDEYRLQHRGGRGLIAIRTSERNGLVVGAHAVMENDALMLITAQGKMIRVPVNDVRVISRVTQGVRLIQLDAGDKLVAATTVEPAEDEALEAAAAEAARPAEAGPQEAPSG
jgi:DNA gyrase subunit A